MGAGSESADELSQTLRDLRRSVPLSSTAAARAAGIGQAALSRYENGRFVPTEDRLNALLDTYGAPDLARRRLVDLVRNLREENRRVVVHRRGAPAFQRRIQEIEASSAHVATFQPTVIPGLLQTEAYMRVLTAGAGQEIADGVIAARRQRQELLGAPGRRWTQIVTAGALLWCAGSAEVMSEQLRHIIDVSHGEGVEVGVIPPRTPATVFPLHGFDLYDERAVIVGTLATTAILTEPADVALHLDMLEQLRGLAVFGDGGRECLERVAQMYSTGTIPEHCQATAAQQ